MTLTLLSAFCQKYNLIFIEHGRIRNSEVYWFFDLDNQRKFYTKEEIEARIIL